MIEQDRAIFLNLIAVTLAELLGKADDLAARLLNPEYGKVEDWKIISLPAICEDAEGDPLGREVGAAAVVAWARTTLPPNGSTGTMPGISLRSTSMTAVPLALSSTSFRVVCGKETVGTYAWSSLYMQTPTPSSGGMFKREWWKRWAALPSGSLHSISR